jgi:flagellin
VQQALMIGRPTIDVALSGATAISNLVNNLEEKLVAYHAAFDTQTRTILQQDIDALLNQIDSTANGSVFNGVNLINTDQSGLIANPPPDEGTSFVVTGGNSTTHALTTSPGTIRVDYTAGGTGGGNLRLVYNGTVMDNDPVNPPNQSGTLTFAYPATPVQNFTVQLVGAPTISVTYTFFLDEQAQGSTTGNYRILRNIEGAVIDVQYRSMLATDLGLRPPNLTTVDGALAQVASAKAEMAQNLGYYGAKRREIDNALDFASGTVDAIQEGLGAIVDEDLGRESANLVAQRAKEQLTVQGLALANATPSVLLGLFER